MRKAICHFGIITALAGLPGKSDALTLPDEPSCTEYVTNFDGSLADAQNKKWLLGFLSGLALNSGSDAVRGTDIFTIYHRVFIYCKEYPDAPLNEAAEAFFNRSATTLGSNQEPAR